MGIASLLLGEQNPFTQWTSQNQNLLNAIGSGLGQGQNIQSGLTAGLAQVPQAKQLDQQQAEKLKASKLAEQQLNATKNWLQSNHPDLAQMVDAGMPVQEAWQAAMQRMQPQGGAKPMEINGQLVDPTTGKVIGDYRDPQGNGDLSATPQGRQTLADQFGLQGEERQMYVLTGKLPGSNQSVRAGVGQPIFGQNRTTGAIEPWQSMTDGTMVNTANPQAKPTDYDFNPGIAAGSRTSGTVDAKTAAAARAALPGAEQMLGITNKAISEVRSNAKGMKEWFGQFGPRGAYILPGSEMGKFIAASSPTNAQAFMQARNMLKGGGQITDYEGRRAEDAMSRMQAALDSGDQDQYLRALADFEQAVAEGYAKLQATAQGAYSAPSPGAQPPAALTNGNVTSSGVQWSVEP